MPSSTNSTNSSTVSTSTDTRRNSFPGPTARRHAATRQQAAAPQASVFFSAPSWDGKGVEPAYVSNPAPERSAYSVPLFTPGASRAPSVKSSQAVSVAASQLKTPLAPVYSPSASHQGQGELPIAASLLAQDMLTPSPPTPRSARSNSTQPLLKAYDKESIAHFHELVSRAGKDIEMSLMQRGKTAGRALAALGGIGSLFASLSVISAVIVGAIFGTSAVLSTIAAPYVAVPMAVVPLLLGVGFGVWVRHTSRANYKNNPQMRAKISELKTLREELVALPKKNAGEVDLLAHTDAVLRRLELAGAPMRDLGGLGLYGLFTALTFPVGAVVIAIKDAVAQGSGGNRAKAGLDADPTQRYWAWSHKKMTRSGKANAAHLEQRNRNAVHHELSTEVSDRLNLQVLSSKLAGVS